MGDGIFVDTGAYLARFSKRDGYHSMAIRIWEDLQYANSEFLTTNHVIDELASLLARRTSYEFSAVKIREIYQSDTLIERSTEEDELEALKYFEKYADQNISFTDCLSFAMMKKISISRVFTFDRHFEYVGFETVPKTGF